MNYIEYLKKELVPAFGCTEPIALAYAAAKATEVMGRRPRKINAKLSANIIKNAYSVTVPGTDGRRGIDISIVTGAMLGDAKKELQVLDGVDKSQLKDMDKMIEEEILSVELNPEAPNLYIEIDEYAGKDHVKVVLEGSHNNITKIIKNGTILLEKEYIRAEDKLPNFSFEDIYDFAKNGDYSEIKDILDKQASYNYDIAVEGLENEWGANIGKLILKTKPNDFTEKMVAYAAAGSDARMSGCEKPVVINSGSGNQGMTLAVPIVLYAKENNIDKDTLYRGLVFGNLLGLYQKKGIGKLSAYCGAVSAAAASSAAIAFMQNLDKQIIKDTIVNALAVNSGLICDGAKASCAMKIASSLRNSFLAYEQAKANQSFHAGDGIVKEDIDKTINTIGRIAMYGMKKTDEIILNEMLENYDYLKDK